MGLINENVKVVLRPNTIKYYESLGYDIPKENNKIKKRTFIFVKAIDLTNSSDVIVNITCDCCNKNIVNKFRVYKKYVKDDGKYYCKSCSNNLFSKRKIKNQKLLKSISFYDWCYNNLSKKNADEIMLRWDEEKNNCNPKDICFSSTGENRQGYWFKCLDNLEHGSELKSINRFVEGKKGALLCKKCNSFAQYLINMYGENALNLYWSDKNIADPWKISKGTGRDIFIKCQNNQNHDDYKTKGSLFLKNRRCPQCNFSKGEFRIKLYLEQNNIGFTEQYIFQQCKYKQVLQFDFYLSEYNTLIEYQGEHHEKSIDFAGKGEKWAEEQFKENQIKDNIKREYAQQNDIKLLEIWYYDFDNIEEILDKYFLKLV